LSGIEKLGGPEDALAYARQAAKTQLATHSLEYLKNTSVAHFLIDLHPSIKAIGNVEIEIHGYVIDESLAAYVVGGSSRSAVLYDVATCLCAANVFNGYKMPLSLRLFARQRIMGTETRPKAAAKHKFDSEFLLKMALRQLVTNLEELFEVDHRSNPISGSLTATSIAAMVASENGYGVSADTIAGWCSKPTGARFREQAEELSRVLDYILLNHIGVVKTLPFFSVGRKEK
jgi:hypothetical protein